MRSLADLRLCSINTATLGFQAPIGETVDAIARAGFGGIAPWRRDTADEDVEAVATRIRDAGLTVSGYCRSTYIPAVDRKAFEAGLEDNRRAILEAAVLDAACFVMVVGGLPAGSRDMEDARAQLADGTAALAEFARSVGVRLALEPLHPMYAADRSCLNTVDQALRLCQVIEPDPAEAPVLGVAVDVYHVWWDPRLYEGLTEAGRQGRIFAFHVSDWRIETRDMLTDRGMMGDGVIDLAKIRGAVEAAGYSDTVEVEIFSALDWWRRPMAETLAVCAERLRTAC